MLEFFRQDPFWYGRYWVLSFTLLGGQVDVATASAHLYARLLGRSLAFRCNAGGVSDAGLQPARRLPLPAGRQLAGPRRGARGAADGRHAQPRRLGRALGRCHQRRGRSGTGNGRPGPAAAGAPAQPQYRAPHQQQRRPGRQRWCLSQRLLRLRPHALQQHRRQGMHPCSIGQATSGRLPLWSLGLM